MDAASTSETLSRPTQRVQSSWRAYSIFAVCSSLYLLPFMRTLFVGSDEGSFLCGAARIAHGQIFARDFFEVMGPGTFYWMALFFRFFRSNIPLRADKSFFSRSLERLSHSIIYLAEAVAAIRRCPVFCWLDHILGCSAKLKVTTSTAISLV